MLDTQNQTLVTTTYVRISVIAPWTFRENEHFTNLKKPIH
jgi:hypothetical protein